MMPPLPPVSPAELRAPRATALDAAATDRLEASFLEKMLKHVGPRTPVDPLSGGAGESEFQSFLTQQYATRLAARLDLGLAPGSGA